MILRPLPCCSYNAHPRGMATREERSLLEALGRGSDLTHSVIIQGECDMDAVIRYYFILHGPVGRSDCIAGDSVAIDRQKRQPLHF